MQRLLTARPEVSRSLESLESFRPDSTIVERWRGRSTARCLEPTELTSWSGALGVELREVKIHDDAFAHRVAAAQEAEAVTVGTSIYMGQEAGTRGLFAHEMAHVAQTLRSGPTAPRQQREEEASEVQQAFLSGKPFPVQLFGPPQESMGHPAARILLRTGRWLLNRTTRALTRHIARHGRAIAGRAVHSIFRNPRAIRDLVGQAVREATTIARNATRHGADEVLEQGGTRIFRQASRAPGKFRVIVEHNFGREIGTRGERILRVIIDMSGRIVTAYPVERFLAAGVGVAALSIFDERTAEASERIRSRIEAEENRPTDWLGEIVDILNPLSGGSLNEGEDLMLDIGRIVSQVTTDIIREIEEAEQRSLGVPQRQAIRDLVEAALGTGLELEEAEPEEEE